MSSEAVTTHPYEALTPDTVIDAVESAGFLSDARILALNSYENRVYQVGLEEGAPLIAKFYRPGRWSDEQILEEHQFTAHLHELDIPVVAPMVVDQRTLHEHAGFRFTLYPRQGGRAPELDNLDHLEQLGQFIGRIHQAGQGFPFKYRIALTVQGYGHNSVAYLLENDFISADLRVPYEAVTHDILALLDEVELDRYTNISLHGDCHVGNVLWRDDRPHFVDFDDALTGPAIQDLWMMLSGETDNRQIQLASILEGYDMFARFDGRELALVESLRALRLLHYNAWLARRWDDPAFPRAFTWFNTQRYWSEHILELKETLSALYELPLRMPGPY
ncbi:MAG: serine/threonine protein kinase [Gammaproteobacteria bacterium]|nr:serine/threonine protein kinase [Gammaproteobacteria bacterium]